MKRILMIMVSLFALNVVLMAQPPKGMGKNDAEAKKILDAVSVKFKSFKTFQASFVLKIENASGKSLGNKTGTVYMKGNRYKINVSGQEIFSDGVTIWTYEKASNEVTINKIDPSSNALTPQKLFTNFYDKDFLYKLNGMVKEGGKNMQEIELTPIDKTKTFHKVLLYIDKSMIGSTKIFEKSGSRYTYTVSNLKSDAALTDQSFVFDAKKYPGVEVVDLR
ncbi:MAG: outer membrane lipoprotein carrier protein LolA [Sphingobacteriales bacterium]|nr:outer membrane lipoprotein carrier protein LolA [Sphingobacteriales bacterium]